MSASFSTHILDQVLQRRAREREVLRTRTLARLRDGLSRLPVAFETVVIFGSLIHPGHFGVHSDIDDQLFAPLDSLRAFRHFFRHAYGSVVDVRKVELVRQDAAQLRTGYRSAVALRYQYEIASCSRHR